jgi:hypothetical protein
MSELKPEVTDVQAIEEFLSFASGDEFFSSLEQMTNWMSEFRRIDLERIPRELQHRANNKWGVVFARRQQLNEEKVGES